MTEAEKNEVKGWVINLRNELYRQMGQFERDKVRGPQEKGKEYMENVHAQVGQLQGDVHQLEAKVGKLERDLKKVQDDQGEMDVQLNELDVQVQALEARVAALEPPPEPPPIETFS